ncbi:MAG TPA: TonB-dependent receptor [Sphingobacteriaceae bacterium]
MKFALLILITVSLQITNAANAQKISLSEKNSSLEEVLKKITEQSGANFLYTSQMLENSRPVNVRVTNVSLKQALDLCLSGQPLSYSIDNNTIVLKEKEMPVITPVAIPVHRLKGRVVDTKGVTLPGASVKIKGTNQGVQTDIDGVFTFPDINPKATLVVSFVGYITQEVAVNNRNDITITLLEESSTMDEVVVVAFGTQKKTDMVGSVTTVNPSDLKVPSSNLTTALAGKIAGVISYQRSGEPGMDNADFFIRGVTSFGTGKVDPLILIDGVELSVTELARLRPDDIQSFSIMKDATATALYGARGANGVVYVTTKQGKEGKTQISFRAESSYSAPTSNVELADPVTYMKLYNDALFSRDPFSQPLYSQEKIDATAEGISPIIFPATDWRKTLFKDNTINSRYNLNVSGGGKVARYYVAGSYAQDNGMLKVDKKNNFNNNIDLKSYTLRANVNIDLTKTTELIVRLNGNFDNYTGPIEGGGAIYNKVVRTNPVDFLPYYPTDDAHAHIQHIMFGGVKDRSFLNPYADMVKGYKDYDRSLMLAQLEVKQDFSFLTKGLSFRSMFNTNRTSRFDIVRAYKPYFYQLDYFNRKTLDYSINIFNENAGEEFLSFGIDDDLREQNTVFYLESAVDYNRTFNKKHTVSGLLVSIMRSSMNAIAGSLQLSLPSRNTGVSGRATYSYDSRYFAEFNFGYNGSERFYQDQRFGFFPSAGVAWSISNEKFWEPLKNKITNLRVRGTYGLVGNDAIGLATDRFFYLSNVNMNDAGRRFTFGREYGRTLNGVTVTRYSNPEITWETAQKTNLALEVGLFNKVNILADFYSETRKNILMERAAIPTTMGLSADVSANVGKASGKGMDISIDYSQNFANSFWLQTRGNFTYSTNKFLSYEEPVYENEWWKSKIGYPLQQQWGYIAERLFVDDNEVANSPRQNFGAANIAGDIKYKDVNGDGEITALDQVPLGFPSVPEIVYGAGFSMGYKNFDISTFFQGSAQSSFWTEPSAVQPFVGGKQIIKAFADSHYSTENPDIYAMWPRLSTANHSNNIQRSTWWINNGAFIRLKQAELGYSLPRKMTERMHMKNLRMYLSGTNLLLLSHFKLWDIEMGGNGLGYPLQRVFNLGVNVTL